MAWIRLDDDYVHHAKFTALSHQSFRLWHEGMAYCRKLLTDGLISHTAIKAFRYASKATVKELTTPIHPGVSPLWEPDEVGYRVHDYLDWNPSSDEDKSERDAAKLRMRAFRGRRLQGVTPDVTSNVLSPVTHLVTPTVTPNVPGQGRGIDPRSERRIESTIDPIDRRAGDLLNRYAALFYEHRRGARYHNRMHIDLPKARDLVRTWDDDARLEKLAILILTTDDDWVSGTDRGFAVFAARASWADDKLTEWEAQHGKVSA